MECQFLFEWSFSLDSLEWSRKFDILSVSRLDLQSLGLHSEQVKRLTDEDMQALADTLKGHYYTPDFLETVKFTTSIILAEKE